MSRHKILLSLTLIGFIILQSCATLPRINDKRPNFLVIVTDDQRFDTMGYMPVTQSVIFDQGVTFTNGFITTPICCPSRASILTGEYAHNTDVHTNDDKLKQPTFIYTLHANGYNTGLVGKYLNSWKGEVRPEFDYWVSFFKGESVYYDPYLNDNGSWTIHKGYITDILADYVVKFLDRAASDPRPFVLLYAPNAPHQPATPLINDDKTQLLNLAPFRPPSYDESDVSDKPLWLQNKVFDDKTAQLVDTFRRDQLLTLLELDRTNAKIFDEMKRNGQLDNTVIIFLSDNGVLWGEHRFDTNKNTFYEEAAKVPFAMRYPPLIPKPYKENRLIANIDIAPTLLQLAGIPIPSNIDGVSLIKLFNGGPWRDSLLLEGWPPRGAYSAVHTDRYVYSETIGDKSEFYDLQVDPYELQNHVDNPAYQSILQDLKQKLYKLQKQSGNPSLAP